MTNPATDSLKLKMWRSGYLVDGTFSKTTSTVASSHFGLPFHIQASAPPPSITGSIGCRDIERIMANASIKLDLPAPLAPINTFKSFSSTGSEPGENDKKPSNLSDFIFMRPSFPPPSIIPTPQTNKHSRNDCPKRRRLAEYAKQKLHQRDTSTIMAEYCLKIEYRISKIKKAKKYCGKRGNLPR